MNRDELLEWAKAAYGTEPEYLWKRTPDCAVLRHKENRKWYGLIMRIPRSRLGLEGEEYVDILNVKADSAVIGSMREQGGIFPGYHMNKGCWISVLLDGSVDAERLRLLLDISFELTDKKAKK